MPGWDSTLGPCRLVLRKPLPGGRGWWEDPGSLRPGKWVLSREGRGCHHAPTACWDRLDSPLTSDLSGVSLSRWMTQQATVALPMGQSRHPAFSKGVSSHPKSLETLVPRVLSTVQPYTDREATGKDVTLKRETWVICLVLPVSGWGAPLGTGHSSSQGLGFSHLCNDGVFPGGSCVLGPGCW